MYHSLVLFLVGHQSYWEPLSVQKCQLVPITMPFLLSMHEEKEREKVGIANKSCSFPSLAAFLSPHNDKSELSRCSITYRGTVRKFPFAQSPKFSFVLDHIQAKRRRDNKVNLSEGDRTTGCQSCQKFSLSIQ